jgi:hypothetical protein
VSGESSVGVAVLVIFVCVWVYSVVVEQGVCIRDCRGLEWFKVGIVGSVDDEYERRMGSLMTG